MRSDILNSKQLEAINTLDGPCMIVAGPGSGKTSVITHKIAHLVDLGVNPYNILAITFTNKAAKEIKARVDKLVNSDTSKLWMGTFHSIFLKLLKVNAHLINYKSDFSIYDTDDSVSLINSIIKDLALSADQYKGSVVYNRI